MNVIVDKMIINGKCRGYKWYDSTKLYNTTNWSLKYERIPEPKIYSQEYIQKYHEDFKKESKFVKLINKIKRLLWKTQSKN